MIDMGVVQVLETLSGTTSGLIQELCAKCICNLTCAEDCHKVRSYLLISLSSFPF